MWRSELSNIRTEAMTEQRIREVENLRAARRRLKKERALRREERRRRRETRRARGGDRPLFGRAA